MQNGFDDNDKPLKVIWRLTWPQVIMMFFHFWIGFVDVLVAGKINREVQASLGLITSCLFFMLIIAQATAGGVVAAISQSIGAGLYKRVQRYVGLSLELALGCGVLIVLVAYPAEGLLIDLLQVPASIEGVTRYFLEVYLFTLLPYYLLLIANAVFRARKEVMIPLYTMMLVMAVNTVADFGLGLGLWGLPNMGYQGLAWATFFSVLAGAVLCLVVLWRKGLIRRESFPPLRWIRPAMAYLIKVAWPAGLMQVLWQSGYLVLFAIVAALPVDSVTALAGMTVGLRIEAILFLPGVAFNMTASVLVGHYLGAGRPAEARSYGFRILGLGVAIISLFTLGVWQFVHPLAAFLSPDAAVQAEIVNYLAYNMLAIPFTLTSMILGGAMVGAGATVYNLAIFGITVWCVRLPLAYVLGHMVYREATGVWVAQLVSQVVQSMALLYFFARGNWQRFALRRRHRNNGSAAPPVAVQNQKQGTV